MLANEAELAFATLLTVISNVVPFPLVNVISAFDTVALFNNDPVSTIPPPPLVIVTGKQLKRMMLK